MMWLSHERYLSEEGERRRKPRINLPFPVIVRGVEVTGNPFEEEATVANFSARGLLVYLEHYLLPGSRVFAVIQLRLGKKRGRNGPRVAIRGTALRVEESPDGRCAVAISFTQYRFL